MDDYKQMSDHLELVMTRLVSGAVEVLEQKMMTASVEREMGDRELRQTLEGNKHQLETLVTDLANMQTGVMDGLKAVKRDLREEWKADVRREVGPLPSIEGRLVLVERKLDAIKWAAFGLSVGSSLGGGTLVAILTGALG